MHEILRAWASHFFRFMFRVTSGKLVSVHPRSSCLYVTCSLWYPLAGCVLHGR